MVDKQHFKFTKVDKDDWQRLAGTVKKRSPSVTDDAAFFDIVIGEMPATTALPKTRKRQASAVPAAKKREVILPELRLGESGGLDTAKFERLRRGCIRMQEKIDLHAHSRDVAFARLRTEIAIHREKGIRALLVITGKGKGILQEALPTYLNSEDIRSHILCFTPATPKDGGEGAFYLYLKKPNK